MREVDILEIALWIFSGGFVAKWLIFGFLTWTMIGQRNVSRLGGALFWHYISLSTQALGLSIIFAYYASVLGGHGAWLNTQQRIAMYVVDIGLVIWATERGVNALRVYFDESRHPDASIAVTPREGT